MKRKIKSIQILFSVIIFAVIFSGCKKSPKVGDINPITKPPVTGTLTVYPSPGDLSTVERLKQSDDYTVEVRKAGETNYQTLFVYKSDNYWVDTYFGAATRPQNSLSFTSFAFKGTSVDVKITTKSSANNVAIRPLNFGINPVKNGNVITFTLTEPKKISVEVNDRKNPLFIFAELPDVPNPNATFYYGPGIHKIGLGKVIGSDQSVYIAAGAIVEGSFMLPYNTKNQSIKGRGILSMGEWPHESVAIDYLGTRSAIRLNGASNFSMEGITITNATGWTIPMYNSDNLTFNNQFRNLKLISFNGNTDGIWVNGANHVIDDCFIFNNDDVFASHGSTNCKVSNIVAWGGIWGRFYYHSSVASTTGLTFENINVIGKDAGVELILLDGDSGSKINVNNVTFRNFRVEQHLRTNSYNTNKFIRFISNYKSPNNWLFENVTIDDKNPDEADFYGTANSPITNIKFVNFKLGGSKVNSMSEGNMDKNSFATNITFE